MITGEYESLKAMHAVSPTFIPEPYAQGHYEQDGNQVFFLIEEFRLVGEQPPNPMRFTAKLAELHRKSVSPTEKFGFVTTTCHAKVTQLTDIWEDSWAVLYRKQLEHVMIQDLECNGPWPEFEVLSKITL
jgi:fructosamine-3-kinase